MTIGLTQTLYPHVLTPRRTNLVTNPGFEVDTTGWSFQGGWATHQRIAGAYGLLDTNYTVQSIGTTGASGYQECSAYYGGPAPGYGARVFPGRTYTAGGFIRVHSCDKPAALAPHMYLRWYDYAGNMISQSATPAPLQTTNAVTGQYVYHTATAPATAHWGQPILLAIGYDVTAIGAVTVNVTWDAAMLEETSTPGQYFDGAHADAWWNGTANASSSSTFGGQRENGVPNPSFETNLTGWEGAAGTGSYAQTRVNTWNSSGDWSMRINGAVGPEGYLLAQAPMPKYQIIPGRTYTLSAKVNVVDAASTLFANIVWWNGANAYIGESPGTAAAAGTGERTVSVTAAAPANAVSAWVRVQGSGSNGETYDLTIDDVIFEEGATVQPYFDGSFTSAVWDGTSHASASRTGITVGIANQGQVDGSMPIPDGGLAWDGDVAAQLINLAAPIVPGVVRPIATLEAPTIDTFDRANETPIASPWVPFSATHRMKILNRKAVSTGEDSQYSFMGHTTGYRYPLTVWTLGGLTQYYDHYFELTTVPTQPAGTEAIELGFFYRPVGNEGWHAADNTTHWYLIWLNAEGGPNVQLTPWEGDLPVGLAAAGDQVGLAYDGNSAFFLYRRPPNAWTLVGSAPLSTRSEFAESGDTAGFRKIEQTLYGGVWIGVNNPGTGTSSILEYRAGTF